MKYVKYAWSELIIKTLVNTVIIISVIASLSACVLYEEPRRTDTGELGVDPTRVIVNVNMTLNLSIAGEPADISPEAVDGQVYLRRFIITVYNSDREPCCRHCVFTPDITATSITIPVSMRLNALRYRIAVWSDYVLADEKEKDTIYDTSTLIPVVFNGDYCGNTNLKDAFSGTVDIDLRQYADAFNATAETDIELKRPMGRYEIVSTDLGLFLKRLSDGTVSGKKFHAFVRYTSFVSTGFNIYDCVRKNSVQGLKYKTPIDIDATESTSVALGFDYVMTAPDEQLDIPVQIDIVNEHNEIVSSSTIRIPVSQNRNSVVRGRFLTASPDGGFNIDNNFDGEITVDIGVITPSNSE